MRASIIVAVAVLSAGCREMTAPAADLERAVSAPLADATIDDGCSFDRGTTTCVTTAERFELSTHQVFSGCVAGPPPFGPGQRIRTFEDTYSVITTTTTYRHGRNGKVYDAQTTEQRQLVSSREVSSVCQRL